MRCLRSWSSAFRGSDRFTVTRSVQKGRGISLSRRDLPVISALVSIRQIQGLVYEFDGVSHSPTVVGANEPPLEVANGSIDKGDGGLRTFSHCRADRLDASDMFEAGINET
jgi:hypothetical protein